LYQKCLVQCFRTAHYRDILPGQSVEGKHKPANADRACSVTDRFRYRSGRIEQVSQYAKDVRSCLAVRHVGEGFRHPPKSRGDFAPPP
jgi:hypothetical protein